DHAAAAATRLRLAKRKREGLSRIRIGLRQAPAIPEQSERASTQSAPVRTSTLLAAIPRGARLVYRGVFISSLNRFLGAGVMLVLGSAGCGTDTAHRASEGDA